MIPLITALVMTWAQASPGWRPATPIAPQTAVRARKPTAAEQSWPAFYAAFRDAVKRRDREALKRMMTADFYSSAGNDPGPDAAFAYWDTPGINGWAALTKVLAAGVAPLSPSSQFSSGRPGRVAPPAANVKSKLRSGAVKWYAVFEYGPDNQWHFVIFDECCD